MRSIFEKHCIKLSHSFDQSLKRNNEKLVVYLSNAYVSRDSFSLRSFFSFFFFFPFISRLETCQVLRKEAFI